VDLRRDDEGDDDFMVDVYRRAGMSSAGRQLGRREGDTNHAHIPGALSAAALVCCSDGADAAAALDSRVVDVELSDDSDSQGDEEATVLSSSPGMTVLFGPPRGGGHSNAAGSLHREAPPTPSPRPPVAPLPSSRSPKMASPAPTCCLDDERGADAGVAVVGGETAEAAAVLLEPEEELDVEDEETVEGRVQ